LVEEQGRSKEGGALPRSRTGRCRSPPPAGPPAAGKKSRRRRWLGAAGQEEKFEVSRVLVSHLEFLYRVVFAGLDAVRRSPDRRQRMAESSVG
jgi:hypothetical protein